MLEGGHRFLGPDLDNVTQAGDCDGVTVFLDVGGFLPGVFGVG
ncbi:hypothetical protein ES703_68966 [subsurface metagenome]